MYSWSLSLSLVAGPHPLGALAWRAPRRNRGGGGQNSPSWAWWCRVRIIAMHSGAIARPGCWALP